MKKAARAAKTNAARMLESAGIRYEVLE